MAKFLTPDECKALTKLIDLTIDGLDDHSPHYQKLYKAYNGFEPKSNSAASIQAIVDAIEPVDQARADAIRGWIFVKIRSNNYPSNWDHASTQAKVAYAVAHPGATALTAASHWRCPGQGTTLAHDKLLADISIDHVIPVAQHWNTVGSNSDSTTRKNWYYDRTNHAYRANHVTVRVAVVACCTTWLPVRITVTIKHGVSRRRCAREFNGRVSPAARPSYP